MTSPMATLDRGHHTHHRSRLRRGKSTQRTNLCLRQHNSQNAPRKRYASFFWRIRHILTILRQGNGRPLGRKLMIIPEPDEPGPSTRPLQSLAVPAISSRQSSRAPSPNDLRPRSPSSQPVPYRALSVQPQPPAISSTTSRKPHSTASHAISAPLSPSVKGKERQIYVPPPSSVTRSSATQDVFDSREIPSRGRSRQPVDSSLPLPLRETPLIDKNREMRSKATERRRNSLEHRRRASESLGRNGSISTCLHLINGIFCALGTYICVFVLSTSHNLDVLHIMTDTKMPRIS